ncbi:MAG: helix-turn-helix domain-containing protein [Theionarchaea archaeon]|nr:helix-turn-helix domain-containing protein [Theionarchaea archaeon]
MSCRVAQIISISCQSCDVSRKTYYKWKNRFQQEGIDGLKDRSRRPTILQRKIENLQPISSIRFAVLIDLSKGNRNGARVPTLILWMSIYSPSVFQSLFLGIVIFIYGNCAAVPQVIRPTQYSRQNCLLVMSHSSSLEPTMR